MKLFLGRRKNNGGQYELGTSEDSFDICVGFYRGTHLMSFCVKEFEKYTSVRLKTGEVKRVSAIEFRFFKAK